MTSILPKKPVAAHTKKSNGAHTENASKSLNITNNSGIDIVIINAFKNDDSETTELYEQSLQIIATTDDQKMIAKGASGTITMNDGQKINNLIIAKASNLAPLKVLDAPTNSETGVTITADDATNARQAETFVQTIVAFPTADLATDYTAALNNADTTTVDNFFKNQDDYQHVVPNMVVAVQTYYNRFPFAYAAYKTNQSYYFYSSDGTNTTYEGSLEIINNNTLPADTDTALGKFSAIFANKSESAYTNLFYANGQFVDNVEATSPVICLTGLFIQRSQLTKVASDKALMPTFSGTVNSKDVFVYDKKINKDSNGFYADLDALVHPKDTVEVIKLIGVIIGAVVAIAILAKVAKTIIDAVRKKNLTPEEIAAKKAQLIEEYRAKTQATLDKMNKRLKIPEDVNVSLAGIKKEANDMLLAESQQKIIDTIAKQQACYEKILEYTSNSKLDKAYDNMEYVYDIVQGAVPADLTNRMTDIIGKTKETTDILNTTYKSIKSKANEADKKAMAEAQQTIDRNTTAIDKNEEIRDELDRNEVPNLDIVE